SALAVMGVALGGLAIYLYRGHAREMHEASQRVNFVNQVSHELKTPLTNIRMYADLMELDLQAIDAESAAKPHSRLQVIISESQRLSRLIGNVLTFAKQQRGPMELRLRTGQWIRLCAR
ncbi:MAG: hypothetical protein IH991_19070, partial [Planctomycetes bacterium]|nr:hypothetical protein [Planctomycetota bacterium]